MFTIGVWYMNNISDVQFSVSIISDIFGTSWNASPTDTERLWYM
jgi:hypothetical protein